MDAAAAEPTEKEKPKKKLILQPQDRIKLGKQLEPLLKPTLKCLVDQLEAAEGADNAANKGSIFSSPIRKDQDETATIRVISYSCVPTIEQLAETITDEKELVILRRVADEARQKAAAESAAKKDSRTKQLVGYEASAARLSASFHRKTNTHLLSSKYYSAMHGWLIFFPIQLIVAAIAIIAFIASYYEIKRKNGVATILTVVAGILGIVAGFLNALDRHLDWRTLHLQHKKSASLYSKLKWDVIMDKIQSATSDEEANLNLNQYNEKLKQLEEHNGDLMVPIEIINCFDAIEDVINERIAIINNKAREKHPELQVAFTAKQDELVANKNIKGYVTDRTKYDILYRCYGLVVSKVMKGGSCCRLPFSYVLPSPDAVVAGIMKGEKYDKFLKEFEKSQTASADAVRDEGTDKNGDGTLPV